MTVELRPYQRDLVADASATLDSGRAAMVQLATGAGKSLVGAAVVVGAERSRNAWLTHRRELRDQAAEHLAAVGLETWAMGEVRPAQREWRTGAVALVSPGLRALPPMPRRPGVLVVDEAHHAPARTWARIIEAWRRAGGSVIGLTATPWRMARSQGFTAWFDALHSGPSVTSLQAAGWLATPRVEIPSEAQLDCAGATLAAGGEYAADWMESETIQLLAQAPVVDIWRERTAGMADARTLWFAATAHAAAELAALLPDAAVLLGRTPAAERDALIAALAGGSLTHLVSVDVLGEGFDLPAVPVIASLRPTRSLAVALQQWGRGARPKGPGGGHYRVLDYATNSYRFGPPDLDREWTLQPRGPRGGGGRSPYDDASCYARCGAILHPSHRSCWRCAAEQYICCDDCKVHRRWTAFSGRARCNACHSYLRAEAARKQRQRFAVAAHYGNGARFRKPADRVAPYNGATVERVPLPFEGRVAPWTGT